MSFQEKQKIVEMARIAARWAFLHPVVKDAGPELMNWSVAFHCCTQGLGWRPSQIDEFWADTFRDEYRAALVGVLKTNVKIEV